MTGFLILISAQNEIKSADINSTPFICVFTSTHSVHLWPDQLQAYLLMHKIEYITYNHLLISCDYT